MFYKTQKWPSNIASNFCFHWLIFVSLPLCAMSVCRRFVPAFSAEVRGVGRGGAFWPLSLGGGTGRKWRGNFTAHCECMCVLCVSFFRATRAETLCAFTLLSGSNVRSNGFYNKLRAHSALRGLLSPRCATFFAPRRQFCALATMERELTFENL